MRPVIQLEIRQLLAAAQVAQIAFLGLIGVGYCILCVAGGLKRNWIQAVAGVALLALTLVLFALTEEAFADRKAMLDFPLPTLPGLYVIKTLLIVDLIAVFFLVASSGGSVGSCYSALYFLLPTLTILLLRGDRPFLQLLIWSTSGLFLLSLFLHRSYLTEQRSTSDWHDGTQTMTVEIPRVAFANKIACGVISLMSFLLSLYISTRTLGPGH
ncbi:MAG TPA: hypothetical protein VGW39_08880 [Chthoniobacterales bacterium]|nr:hypothetical protein [Chthoniobacterales bacterium]